jgi:hypothetical protein
MTTARRTRRTRTSLALAASLTASLLTAGTAQAQTISTLPAEYNFLADAYTGANYRYVGENFVVPAGPGNGFLKSLTVGVEGWSGSPEQVQLRTFVYAWDGNRPTGPALYTGPIFSPPATRGFVWHTFAPDVQLTVGGSYVFFLSGVGLPQPTATTFYGIAQRGTTVLDAYVPGIRVNADDPNFANLSTTTWFKSPDRDIAFELTFGAAPAATVPEPGTWAMLGTGLLIVGGTAARRRRTA